MHEADRPEKQVASLMNYVWSLTMPTFLTDKGFLGHIYRSLTDYVDPRYGDPKYTAGQSALRLVGVNIYPIDPERSRNENLRWMMFDMNSISSRADRELSDPNLSQEEREKIAAKYGSILRDRSEQIQAYQEKSKIHPNLR
jgi:hypothetical protein